MSEASHHNHDEQALRAALEAPEMRAGFAIDLAAQLNQQFIEQKPRVEGTLSMLVRSKRCHWDAAAKDPERNKQVATVRREVRRLSSVAVPPAKLGRPLALLASLAAVLLASVWIQPQYRWDRSLAAVQQQACLNVTLVTETGPEKQSPIATRQSGRFSAIALAASPETVAGITPDQQARRFTKLRRPVAQIEADLFGLFVGEPGNRRPRPVRASHGRTTATEAGVELDVTLRSAERAVRVRLLIDPATHLLLAGEVLAPLEAGSIGPPVRRFMFSYPSLPPAQQAIAARPCIAVLALAGF